jgi:hypothetical protein
MLFLFLGIYFFKEYKQEEDYVYREQKIKGVSFVAPKNMIGDTSITKLKQKNIEWIALMPYGFVPEQEFSLKYSKEDDQNVHWWGESPNGIKACIKMAKNYQIKVMVKPHIWLGRGEFTGHLDFKTTAQWEEFEKTYASYLLQYAKISEQEGVEMFCIGTEMQNHVKKRPEFWKNLIASIKQVYSGKLTYAENWDAYQDVPFWNELDYIGIDAYFPLTQQKNPELSSIKQGWQKHLKAINKYANKQQKAVLFTEIGYRSCDFSLDKPWETDYSLPPNEEVQALAYKAFHEEVWNKSYFAGAFIWKWFPENSKSKQYRDLFTPQNKLAEKVLTKIYAQ